ncbi:MAG: TonB-dependent receptor plug domain-containing protein, partial [Bacteroidota bacterium]
MKKTGHYHSQQIRFRVGADLRCSIICLFFFFLVSPSIFAQTDTVSSDLQEITAEEIPEYEQPVVTIQAQSVKSQQFAKTSVEYVKPISQRIVLHDNLAQGMRDITSLYLKSNGGNGFTIPSIRGMGAGHTQYFWNGVPITSPTLGVSDVSMFNMIGVERVDILYGGSSLLNGSGGLGGSIEVVQHKYYTNRKGWDHSLNLLGGSFGRIGGGFSGKYTSKNVGSWTAVQYQEAQNDYPFVNTQLPG